MKNIPKKIYLQIDPEKENPEDFKELREVTWCEDRINDNDVEYIMESEIAKKLDELDYDEIDNWIKTKQ